MAEENEEVLSTNETYSGRLLKISEVARLLRVDGATIRKWCKLGVLEYVELPVRPGAKRRALRIKGSAVDRILGHRS